MPQQQALFGHDPAADRPGRRLLWLALLIVASVAFSLGFACAVPLAAFAAGGALTLRPRDAVLLTAAVWLANQMVGFAILHYPWTPDTFAGGVALGIAGIAATVASLEIARRLGRAALPVAAVAAFLGAFAVYEGGLYILSVVWIGGTEDYTAAIVWRIFEINAAAMVGILIVHRLAMTIGLTSAPPARFPAAARHA